MASGTSMGAVTADRLLTERKVKPTLSVMESNSLDAQGSLDAVAAAERRSVEIATSTAWYAPWYGVTCSLIPAAFAFLAASQVGVGIALITVECASLALLVTTYMRVTGVWPASRGMTRHFTAAIIVLLSSGILNYLISRTYGVGWWVILVALVTSVLMAVLSRSYDAALVRRLGHR